MMSPGFGDVMVSTGALVSRTTVIGDERVPSTPLTTTTASITFAPVESGIWVISNPAVFGIGTSAPVMTEPSSRVTMMRIIASLLSSRSCGSVPLTVVVAAAVIGSLGAVKVGRPGSSEAGGGVGELLAPIEVMKGSATTARPMAPTMTTSVMSVERVAVIVPPVERDEGRDRGEVDSTR